MDINSFPNNRDEYIGAEEVMRWLHGRTSGVFGAENNAAVQPASGMNIAVTDGVGWMSNSEGDGIVWWNNTQKDSGAAMQLTLSPAESALNRIDRVIVEWKTTGYADLPTIRVLEGESASQAVPPELTNNTALRQISLARISVRAGVTTITASMITDERLDPAVCGIVTGAISVDTTVISAQVAQMIQETQKSVSDTLSSTTSQADQVLADTKKEADNTLDSIQKELADLEAGASVELKKLLFRDTTVAASAWAADDTYKDYPFRAGVPLSGVIPTMIPNVVFPVDAILNNNFAAVCECYNGGIYIYADNIPVEDVVIPTIICWRQ